MSQEQDKALSELYLARSEGKIIQATDIDCKWHDKLDYAPILYGNRIKPQTVEEAAMEASRKALGIGTTNWTTQFENGFETGAQWQREKDDD